MHTRESRTLPTNEVLKLTGRSQVVVSCPRQRSSDAGCVLPVGRRLCEFFAPTACSRGRFTSIQRFAILSGVCLGFKYVLVLTAIGVSVQPLLLAMVTTALVWALWSAGPANRRLMLGVTAMLWLATAVKVLRA